MARIQTKFITDAAVTAAKLAADSVTTAKILNANVTDAKLATGINANKLADGSVSNAEFQTLDGAQSSLQAQIDQESIIKGDNRNLGGSIGSWLAYADAAQSVPVDGTGGSPVLTVTRSTVAPINGLASLLLDKDAANRQGNGGSALLDVAPMFRGKPVKLSFAYEGSVNFSFANQASDVQVFVYDVTNAQVLQPNSIYLDGSGFYTGSLQLASNCAQIRVILHVATTSALAWTLKADEFSLTLNQNEFANADSDWVAYTPTFTGLGTVTSVNFFYRKSGPNIQIMGRAVAGTTTATENRISFPAGILSSSILTAVTKVGEYQLNSAGAIQAFDVLANGGLNYVTVGYRDGTTTGLVNITNGFTNNAAFSILATVPVQGWTSGTTNPAAIGLNAQAVFVGTQTSEAVTANTTNITLTATKDTTGSWSTNVYNVRSPGDYLVAGSMITAATAAIQVYRNGALVNAGASLTTVDTAGRAGGGAVLVPNCVYGDTISIRSTATTTVSSGYISIHKLGSDVQPYAPRIAYIEDLKAANTSGGTFTSGAWQTRTLNTLTGDSSFISLASNQFTLQPGTYHIEATAPAYRVSRHKAKLRQTSGTPADIIIGSSEYSDSTNLVSTSSRIQRTISISTATTYEIQHQAQTTQATFGFGVESNFGVSEIYTQVKITKVL